MQWLHYKPKLAAFASLGLATALCAAMLVVRLMYAREWTHIGLAWNLFLAWIPLLLSLAAHGLYARRTVLGYVSMAACAIVWLLFFPNALYVVTDLLHLWPKNNVPIWFDLVMILSFAWTSYLLGIVSLYLMQSVVSDSFGKWTGWLFVIITLGLGSLGVYLGRFLRWNSWDVFFQPASLMQSMWDGMRDPLAHPRTLVFSLLFALFFISSYLTLFTLTLLPQERRRLE